MPRKLEYYIIQTKQKFTKIKNKTKSRESYKSEVDLFPSFIFFKKTIFKEQKTGENLLIAERKAIKSLMMLA